MSDLLNQLLGSLNPSQKLIVEAVNKMIEGKRLFQEGLLELSHLTGEKTSVRLLTPESVKPDASPKRHAREDVSREKICAFVAANRRATCQQLQKETGVHFYRARAIADTLVAEGRISRVKIGRHTYWVPPGGDGITAVSAAAVESRKKDFGDQAPLYKEVLDAIKADPWSNHKTLVKKTRRSFGRIRYALDALLDAKLIKSVKKSGNPDHKAVSKQNKRFDYYEAVPGADVKVDTFHIKHTHVKYEDHKDKVLDVIRSSGGWATMSTLQETLKMGRYTTRKMVSLLKKEGSVTFVNKARNPIHQKEPRAYAREFAYLVAK